MRYLLLTIFSLISFCATAQPYLGSYLPTDTNTVKGSLKVDSNFILTSKAASGSTETLGVDSDGNIVSLGVVSGSTSLDTPRVAEVIIIAGQSNALGVGDTAELTQFPLNELQYNYRQVFQRSWAWDAPSGSFQRFDLTDNPRGYNDSNSCLELPLAIAHEHFTTTGNQYTVKTVIDGGAILGFVPGKVWFSNTVQLMDSVRNWLNDSGYVMKVTGVIWVHGESDWNTSVDDYRTRMDSVFNGFYDSSVIDYDTRLIISGISSTAGSYIAGVDSAQLQFVRDNYRFARYIDNDSATFNDDNAHYDQMGLLNLGWEADALINDRVSLSTDNYRQAVYSNYGTDEQYGRIISVNTYDTTQGIAGVYFKQNDTLRGWVHSAYADGVNYTAIGGADGSDQLRIHNETGEIHATGQIPSNTASGVRVHMRGLGTGTSTGSQVNFNSSWDTTLLVRDDKLVKMYGIVDIADDLYVDDRLYVTGKADFTSRLNAPFYIGRYFAGGYSTYTYLSQVGALKDDSTFATSFNGLGDFTTGILGDLGGTDDNPYQASVIIGGATDYTGSNVYTPKRVVTIGTLNDEGLGASSGSDTTYALDFSATNLNFTGTYSGVFGCIKTNPNIIADSGEYRPIEVPTGNMYVNTTSGSTIIGADSLRGTGQLEITGNVSVTGADSANTYRWDAAAGDTPSDTGTPAGWLIINVAGSKKYIPYYE